MTLTQKTHFDVPIIESEDKNKEEVEKELKKMFMYSGNRSSQTKINLQDIMVSSLSDSEFEATVCFKTNVENEEELFDEMKDRIEELDFNVYNLDPMNIWFP